MRIQPNRFMFLVITFVLLDCSAEQEPSSEFDLVREQIDGQIAFETVAYVEQYWRQVGSEGFNKAIFRVIEDLEEAGYVNEDKAGPNDELTYRLEERELAHPTWEPVDARVTIAGENLNILDFESNRNMIAINSHSTPDGGIEADVVKLEKLSDLENTDVSGKIVFIESHPARVFQKAVTAGALGIMTYNNPDYLQPSKNSTSIQFRNIPYLSSSKAWGIVLSYAAKEKINNAINAGNNRVNVEINTKMYPSVEYTLLAEVHGSVKEDERLVFSAHVQEPGANDNASGVGALTEIATAIANLTNSGQLKLKRTLTMLWGDEISSTRRYIKEDSVRARSIKWGISLDMVGENTDLTGGSFLIEKMPDPSAIWTRGQDRHTEWGGSRIQEDQIIPHYFNDFIINQFKQQGEYANWTVNTNPYEGGSDHVPFLRSNIPGLLLWHFTDQFYHTDNDRLDKVSVETLKNVSTAALVSAVKLLNATEDESLEVIKIVENAAMERLMTEKQLTKAAYENSTAVDDEDQIIPAWKEYYIKSLETIYKLPLEGPSDKVKAAIIKSQKQISDFKYVHSKQAENR